MPRLPRIALFVAMLLPACAAADPQAPAPHAGEPGFRLTRADAWFGVATVAAVAIAAHYDQQVTDQMPENPSDAQRRFSDVVRPLGSPALLVPVAAGAWIGGYFAHAPGVQDAATRSIAAVGAAGLVTVAIKYSVGRTRPIDSPHDSRNFDPFSGHDSFPSGHTTVAFAAARALDLETTTPWVPILGYPLAALCGYSRILDRRHWLSDVVAGAAVGCWTADKAETFMRHTWRGHMPLTTALLVEPGRGTTLVGLRATY